MNVNHNKVKILIKEAIEENIAELKIQKMLNEGLLSGKTFKFLKDKFVNTIDYLSKVGGGKTQIQGAMQDFIQAYADLFESNTIGADKYFHCIANCRAARRGWIGKTFAVVFSELRELTDEYLKGDMRADCDEDRYANIVGQKGGAGSCDVCAGVCKEFIPTSPSGKDMSFFDKYITKHS